MGKKQKVIWFLAGLILGGVIVAVMQKEPEKIDVSPYNNKIMTEQATIDSLLNLLANDSVVIEYKTKTETIYKERDEKIDSVINLSNDSKLEFFSGWLSEMDSLSN